MQAVGVANVLTVLPGDDREVRGKLVLTSAATCCTPTDTCSTMWLVSAPPTCRPKELTLIAVYCHLHLQCWSQQNQARHDFVCSMVPTNTCAHWQGRWCRLSDMRVCIPVPRAEGRECSFSAHFWHSSDSAFHDAAASNGSKLQGCNRRRQYPRLTHWGTLTGAGPSHLD